MPLGESNWILIIIFFHFSLPLEIQHAGPGNVIQWYIAGLACARPWVYCLILRQPSIRNGLGYIHLSLTMNQATC